MLGSVGTCPHMVILMCKQTHSHHNEENLLIDFELSILFYICPCSPVIISHYSVLDFLLGITFLLLKCASFFFFYMNSQEGMSYLDPVIRGFTENIFILSFNNSSTINFSHYTGSTVIISWGFVAAQIIALWTICLLRNPFWIFLWLSKYRYLFI